MSRPMTPHAIHTRLTHLVRASRGMLMGMECLFQDKLLDKDLAEVADVLLTQICEIEELIEQALKTPPDEPGATG